MGEHGIVTVSIGAATIVAQERGNAEQLVAAADACLYRAKNGGRNRFVIESDARLR